MEDEAGLENPHLVLSQSPEREALELEQHVDLPRPLDQNGPGRTAPSVKSRFLLARLWYRHIVLTVPHEACRDHLANERTFLGYIRTAQALAMLGVVIAQLMRLQPSINPDPVFGYYVLSVPLSSICHASAVVITLLGFTRYFHWQKKISIGKSISSGWEILSTFFLTALVLLVIFAVMVAIMIKES